MNQQEIEQRIKKGYDTKPYPGIGTAINPSESWPWANIEWLYSLLPFVLGNESPFRRILIAGCGTGNEAFQMLNLLPDAEITAVDYSEPSIRVAKKYQNDNPRYRGIDFQVGDLTVGEGGWAKADYYDLISCHGTMTYIPDTQGAFDVIAKCLSPTGIFYLGVNGSSHVSIPIRKSFAYMRLNFDGFDDTLENRRLIELFERLNPTQNHLSGFTAPYLDSDLLNPFSLNLALPEWIEYANRSQLHFVNSSEFIPALAKTISPNIFPLLFPQPREVLCNLVAINTESSFHKLVFSKQPLPEIPWTDADALLDCEFQTTNLHVIQNPISDIYGELILNATIAQGMTLAIRWPLRDVNMRLLSQTQKKVCIRDTFADLLESHSNDEYHFFVKLFMFYHLGIIKIFPPAPPVNTETE